MYAWVDNWASETVETSETIEGLIEKCVTTDYVKRFWM